jgi:hypothetical protein
MKLAFQSPILTAKLRSFCGLKWIESQLRQTTRGLEVRTSGGCLRLKTNGVLIHIDLPPSGVPIKRKEVQVEG